MTDLNTTYFISGHLDLTYDEFIIHYSTHIMLSMLGPNTSFVVGDAKGADAHAQDHLHREGVKNVTVYHMFDSPRHNVHGYPTIGGFKTDEERDTQMTLDSDDDIAWVRYERQESGTQANLNRRVPIQIKNWLREYRDMTFKELVDVMMEVCQPYSETFVRGTIYNLINKQEIEINTATNYCRIKSLKK